MTVHPVVSRVLVGREHELQALQELLAAAVAGQGGLAFVGGEAGIGKSRLCRELRHVAVARDVRVLEGRCAGEEDAVPYGPFMDALRFRLARGEGPAATRVLGPVAAHLAALLPELTATPGPAPSPDAAEARPFDAIFSALQRLADLGPVLFILEDVHWADPTSRELLLYLARRLGELPMLLVATYRTDELHLRHPLRRTIALLTAERRARALVLPPLAEGDVARMIAAIAGSAPGTHLVHEVARRTEGNPFFVEELIKGLAEAGRLVPGGGTLALTRGDLPATVSETVLARLAPLGERVFDVLCTAAVIGRHFDFDLLQQVTGLSEAELLPVVERLVAQHVLVEHRVGRDDRLGFRHALVQEVLYDHLLTRRRRVTHRAVATALEALPPAAQALAVDALAFHWTAAGDAARARRYTVRAGDHAARLHAWQDAELCYTSALAPEPGVPADPALEADLHEKLAYVSWWQGQAERALGHAEAALVRRRQLGAGRPLAVTLRYAGLLHAYQRGAWTTGTAMLREAQALLAAEPAGAVDGTDAERLRVANDLGRVLAAQGEFDEAATWLGEALALARRIEKPVEEVFALAKLGYLDVARGRVAAGLARLEEAHGRLPALTLPLDRATGIFYAGIRGLELARENARALEWLAQAGAYCERHGAAAHVAINDVLRASVERRRGRGEDALAVASRAVETLRAAKRAEVREALRVAGDLHRVRGDAAAAWRAYDEAVRLGDRDSELGAALLLLAADRATDAAARLDAALAAAPASHHLLRLQLLALAVQAHVEAGAFADAHARLEALRTHAAGTDHRAAPALSPTPRGWWWPRSTRRSRRSRTSRPPPRGGPRSGNRSSTPARSPPWRARWWTAATRRRGRGPRRATPPRASRRWARRAS
jgi:tetratricopeptide (TPR) repeat protein